MQKRSDLLQEIVKQLESENYSGLTNLSALLMCRADEAKKRTKRSRDIDRQCERLRCFIWFTAERMNDPERLHDSLLFMESALKVERGEV